MSKSRIIQGIHKSKVECSSELLRKLRESLTYPTFSYSPQTGRIPTGSVEFVSAHGEFRSGLCDLVQSRLDSWHSDCVIEKTYELPIIRSRGIDIKGTDTRNDGEGLSEVEQNSLGQGRPDYFQFLDNFEYREYIPRSVDGIRSAQRGIWYCATNAGKTYMAAAAVRDLGIPTIFLVPPQRSDLVFQAYADFSRVGYTNSELSWVKGTNLTDTPFVIASTATIASRLDQKSTQEWLRRFQFVIYDECHEISPTAIRVLDSIDAPYRLFMSGTPFYGDKYHDTLVMGLSGKILSRITNEELVKLGYSAEPHVIYYKILHRKRSFLEPYKKVYKEEIEENEARNLEICELTKALVERRERVVIHVLRKNHARKLHEILTRMGVRAVVYTGDLQSGRREVLQRFRDFEFDVLIANQIFDTGVSVSEVTVIILAGSGKAVHTNLQRLGRGVRRKSGRNLFFMIDLQDEVVFLKGQSNARREIWRKESACLKHEASSVAEVLQIIDRVSTVRRLHGESAS